MGSGSNYSQPQQAQQVNTCENCTQVAKEALVKVKPHLLPLQVTKITFPGLALTLQQQQTEETGTWAGKSNRAGGCPACRFSSPLRLSSSRLHPELALCRDVWGTGGTIFSL